MPTNDVTVKHNTTFTGYAGLRAGAITPAAGNSIATNGAILGARVEKNGTYLNAEVGIGTAFTGEIEAGHEFNIGKNMGLDLSANVYGAKSTGTNSITLGTSYNDDKTINTTEGNVALLNSVNSEMTTSWKPAEVGARAKAQLNFKPTKRISLGVGFEGGVEHSIGPNVNYMHTGKNTADVTVNGETQTYTTEYSAKESFDARKTKGYITPKIAFKMDLGKKNQIGLFADASLKQRQVGVRYNF